MMFRRLNGVAVAVLLITGIAGGAEKMVKGWLGVVVEDLSPAVLVALGVENGVVVSEVVPDSPAAKAGLKTGDVIVQVAGERIFSSNGLRQVVARRPGQVVEIVIVRRLKELRRQVELARRASDKDEYPQSISREALRRFYNFFRKFEPQLRWQQKGYEEALESLQVQLERLKEELKRLQAEKEKARK